MYEKNGEMQFWRMDYEKNKRLLFFFKMLNFKKFEKNIFCRVVHKDVKK